MQCADAWHSRDYRDRTVEFSSVPRSVRHMEMEITLPDAVPVMTLPSTALFPHALLPLHIFEPRYRQMLRDVLAANRIFAVAGLDESQTKPHGQFEPPHRIATVGIVRACQKNQDGTSELLLQGLCRVEVLAILAEEPYRRVQIRALESVPIGDTETAGKLRRELARLIGLKQKLGAAVPAEMARFLRGIEDPETFADLAAFSVCGNIVLKQKLLETLDVRRRLELFSHHLKAEVEALRMNHLLQGRLSDERISDN